jgi:hypothetical protein
MVADFVAGGGDFASHCGQAADIHSALKEGGRSAIASQDFEQLGVDSLGPSSKVRAMAGRVSVPRRDR